MTESFADAKILVVDDEPTNVLLMERLLEDAGYTNVASTTDSRRVLDLYRSFAPDLLLLDLMMPHLDGLAVLGLLKTEIPADVYVPVLVLTADATLEAKRRVLAAGARDFLTKPFEQFEVLLRIRNLLDVRRLYLALEAQNRALEDTVRQRTERLLQSEKVATMGSLLAGVAHELNNPLAVLIGQAHLLQQGARGDAGLSRRAQKIDDAAERCARIVRNFLSLARQRTPERSSTSLGQVVQGALELLAYELRSDQVEITVDLAADLPILWADPHQLHQVLVNLIANAHHAMRRQSKPRRITIRAHPVDDGSVRLELADTGPGIAPEVLAKIFEPFFTTKPTGEGTGLGLSLCRGIVEEHGGTLDVVSVVGEGATFVIALPVGAPSQEDAATASSGVPPAPRRATIMVVDDERAIAETVAEALETQGHTADIAENGLVALEMLERRAYDLVISDGKMPVLDGEAFWAEVGRRFPGVQQRIIFLTGDVLSREKREFLERVGAPWLTKPFDLDDLVRLAHQMLAAPRS